MQHRSVLAFAAILAGLVVVLVACTADPAGTATPEPAMTGTAETATPEPAAEPTGTETVSATPSASPTEAGAPADPLLAVELVDVRSGETFTLGELAADHGPVLLEPMAIWCSSCRAQQREVVRAHESASFSSVSLDVDLSERAEDLAVYADREAFDWYFAMADAELYRLLQERFGINVTNPPTTPLIVIKADGTVRPLEFGRGVRSADQLLAELGAG